MTGQLDDEDRAYLLALASHPMGLGKTTRRDRLQKAGYIALASRMGNSRAGTWRLTSEGAAALREQLTQ